MLQYRLAQKEGERAGGEGENAKLLCPQSPACKHPESSRQFNLPLTEAFFYFSPQFLLKNSEASPGEYAENQCQKSCSSTLAAFSHFIKALLTQGKTPRPKIVLIKISTVSSVQLSLSLFLPLFGERGQNVSFLKVRALSRSRRETDGK